MTSDTADDARALCLLMDQLAEAEAEMGRLRGALLRAENSLLRRSLDLLCRQDACVSPARSAGVPPPASPERAE